MTDDTSTEWWHLAAQGCDAVLFTKSRVKFIRPDGTVGGSPSNNTCLFAKGQRAVDALKCANINGLGLTLPLPSMGVWP